MGHWFAGGSRIQSRRFGSGSFFRIRSAAARSLNSVHVSPVEAWNRSAISSVVYGTNGSIAS